MNYEDFKYETTAESVASFKQKIKEAESYPSSPLMSNYIFAMKAALKQFEEKLLRERLEKFK